MALSRERIAAELVKLLAVADPVPTVTAMLGGGLFEPVLPEIIEADRLAALVAAETEAGIAPDGLRRLAALLPPSPTLSEQVAARLRLSKAERRRLVLAADLDVAGRPDALAYSVGAEAAVDRLLLAGEPVAAKQLEGWQRPLFPLSGGDLIALGLTPGPSVAATMRAVEQRWVDAGFPDKTVVDAFAREAVVAVVGG
jgi:poly(A) polymerase